MRQYNVKSYKELLESLKKASVEIGAIINIESDITVADAIEIKEYNNLKITSQNGSTLIGGLTDCHWEQEGDFLTFKTEFEPRMLIINDSLRDKSSYPENGFLEYSNTSDLLWRGSRNGGWNRIPTTEELTHVSVNPKDLPENLDIDNCDIRVMHEWDESTVAIKDYDSTTGIITTKYPMGHPAGTFGKNQYQISNTRSGLKTPGTWCYDRKNKKIYYYPIVGETAQNIKSIIPVSNSIIKVKNCKNITIENLKIKFSNSRCGKIAGLRAINPDGAIQVEQSENINIDMTEISFSGGQGIKFLNSKNISVSNCIITKCAACGIATYDCENELISYNEITDIGILDFSAVAIHAGGKSLLVYVLGGNITEKGQTIVEYNSIDNVPYCGITCSGDSHIIRNNKISRCMMILGDGGAIYCSRGNKTLIHENYICDIPEKNA